MLNLVYIYRQSGDGGKELRHSLRSLANIKCEKNVYIVGESEPWLTGVEIIPFKLWTNSPYSDVWAKLKHFISIDTPEEFWLMQDDIYYTKKQALKTLYDGTLPVEGYGMHKRGLQRSREALEALNKQTKNYDIHVPFKVEKKRLLEVAPHIEKTLQGVPMQWRSFYGNYFDIGGEQYDDKKTKTSELKQGDIISTQFFTEELAKLFPEPSQYEKDKGVTS